MKSNIAPPDVDTIVVDVNVVMCDTLTENSNVEELSTEPLAESEDTSAAANHSFPANTSRNSETRRKRKSGKRQALSQLLALQEGKIEQLEKVVQQKSIMSTEEDEGYQF
jgi:homoaconitase/3-isopropylmalate dehydratase large subunit